MTAPTLAATRSPGHTSYTTLADATARTWAGHGILAHNLVKISALTA